MAELFHGREAKKRKQPQRREAKVSLPVVIPKEEKNEVKKKSAFLLYHPEAITFEDDLKLGDKKFHRKCEGGCLWTGEEVLKDFLINSGWILRETILP